MFKYLQIYTFAQSCFSVGYILSSRSLCSILFSHKHHSQESQYYAGVPAYISPSRGRTILGATGPINRGAWRNEVRWRQGQEASLPPHVRKCGFSEANVLHWRQHVWPCWDFRRPPQWFGAPIPHSDSAPGKSTPLPLTGG